MVASPGGRYITQMSDFSGFYDLLIRLPVRAIFRCPLDAGFCTFVEFVNGVFGSHEPAVR
jgi:hypothetical protein